MTTGTPRPLRLVHYLNAFFGGIGGEAEAHHAVETHAGPLGPGKLLQQTVRRAGRGHWHGGLR